MKQKVDTIQKEIQKFTEGINNFAKTCDEELNKIVINIDKSTSMNSNNYQQ